MKPQHFPSAALTLQSAAFLWLGIFLLAIFSIPAKAQGATRSVEGIWVNVDSTARSLTMMDVQGRRIHLYGQCHPQPCAWPMLKAKPTSGANGVNGLQASVHQGAANKSFTLAVEPDGRLRVELLVHFKADARSDYSVVEYFVRGRQPGAR